jgi:hypothetical protein
MTIEKISKFESPEKWIVRNDDWAECIRGTQYHLTGIAIRVLLNAFLYLLSYRPIEWTAEGTAEWEKKKRDSNLEIFSIVFSPTLKSSDLTASSLRARGDKLPNSCLFDDCVGVEPVGGWTKKKIKSIHYTVYTCTLG